MHCCVHLTPLSHQADLRAWNRQHDRELKSRLGEFVQQENHLLVVMRQAQQDTEEFALRGRAEKLASKLEKEAKQLKALEIRHGLEIEGYINEAKMLRMRLKMLNRCAKR